jgi:hypothetical protein
MGVRSTGGKGSNGDSSSAASQLDMGVREQLDIGERLLRYYIDEQLASLITVTHINRGSFPTFPESVTDNHRPMRAMPDHCHQMDFTVITYKSPSDLSGSLEGMKVA